LKKHNTGDYTENSTWLVANILLGFNFVSDQWWISASLIFPSFFIFFLFLFFIFLVFR
jgi:hypothetical protein